LLVVLLGTPESRPHELKLLFVRLDALLRLLLEGMPHIDYPGETHCIDPAGRGERREVAQVCRLRGRHGYRLVREVRAEVRRAEAA